MVLLPGPKKHVKACAGWVRTGFDIDSNVGIMLVAAKPISEFIARHPSFKILALCFLLIIGMSLVAEGLHVEIPKGYIYFAMAFAFLVDLIQMKTVPKAAGFK